MRDGRRKRLGLVEGSKGTVGDTYLDRILTDAEATENPYTIAADTDVNFDTRDFRNISDTYNYYYGGGADASTAAATQDFTGGEMIDTSGGGQATSGVNVTTGTNTPEQQRLIDEGIGVQLEPGTPVVAPSEMPVTQQEMDDFNAIPVNQNYDLLNSTYDTEIEDEIYEGPTSTYDAGKEDEIYKETPTYYDGTATLQDAGAGEGDMYTTDFQGGEPLSFDDRNQSIEDIDRVSAPYGRNPITGEAYQTPRSIADQNAVLGQTFEPEQQGIIDQVFSKVGSTAKNIMDDFSRIPGAIVDFANQTVDIFGKKINIGKTLLSAGVNRIVGGPISLVFDAAMALGKMLPKDSLENSTTRSIAAQLTAENDYEYNMQSGNIGQDPFGRNPVSAFGNYEQTLAEDAAYVGDSNFSNAKKQYAQDYFNAKSEVAGGVDMGDGTVLGPGEALGDVVSLEDMLQEQRDTSIDAGIQAADDDSSSEMLDTPTDIVDVQAVKDAIKKAEESTITNNITSNQIDEFNIDPVDDISLIDAAADYQVQPTNVYQGGGSDSSTVDSSGNVTDSSGQSQGNINDEFSQPKSTFEDQSYSGGGGGGGNGGGKSIVCTAMYQTTGLEDWSKAMKIWYIYQKKYLTIQHQEGYHKLFKPFVKGMHKNKIIRAIGAHVAKHRTQDLKHIMFGSKSSWLGRVYRKILEPICYLVGKYAK